MMNYGIVLVATIVPFLAQASASAVSATTNLLMNKNGGCILIASFKLKAASGSSSSIQVIPKWVQPVCDYGAQARIGTTMNQEEIQVIYANFGSPNVSMQDQNICVAGPQEVYVSGTTGYAEVKHQAFPMDRSQYMWSQNSLYNLTSAAVNRESVKKLDVNCHFKGDTGNPDAVLFANQPELLKMLPNPYSEEMVQFAKEGRTFANSEWEGKEFKATISALATHTSVLPAKRTWAVRRSRH